MPEITDKADQYLKGHLIGITRHSWLKFGKQFRPDLFIGTGEMGWTIPKWSWDWLIGSGAFALRVFCEGSAALENRRWFSAFRHSTHPNFGKVDVWKCVRGRRAVARLANLEIDPHIPFSLLRNHAL